MTFFFHFLIYGLPVFHCASYGPSFTSHPKLSSWVKYTPMCAASSLTPNCNKNKTWLVTMASRLLCLLASVHFGSSSCHHAPHRQPSIPLQIPFCIFMRCWLFIIWGSMPKLLHLVHLCTLTPVPRLIGSSVVEIPSLLVTIKHEVWVAMGWHWLKFWHVS